MQKTRLDSFHYIFIPFHPFFPSIYLSLQTSQLSIICSGFLVPGRTGFHHVVHAYDRDADYNFGGVEWLGEPVYLNPKKQKLTFVNQ